MVERTTQIETKIIKYLALNPRQNDQRLGKNVQQMQRGIGLEDKNYPTVKKAIERLRKKYIVKFKEDKSEKNVTIKFYRLTPKGVFVALGISDEAELIKILGNYKNESSDLLMLKQYTNFLSEATAVKILRSAGTLALSHLDLALPELLISAITSNALMGLEGFSEEEKKEISEAAAKIDKVKAQLKVMFEYAKNIIFETENFLNGSQGKRKEQGGKG